VAEAGDEKDAVDVAVALRAALAATPFLVGQEVHELRARVGIATVDPAVEAWGDELVERASTSLAHARALGGLTGSAESEALHGRAEACDRIRAALGGAVAREELELAFSPAWRDGELVALEAQLRWNGALGFVSPDAFLPVADQTGDIITIGEWALRQALEAFAHWRTTGAIADDVDLVIGVTPVQMRFASLPDAVIAAVADAGIPLERLVLEPNRRPRAVGRAAAAVGARLALLGVRVSDPGQAVPGAIRGNAIEAGAVAGPGAR
jgi:predicted signal transduction protein with EAL and GGDEF domain